MLSAGPPVGKRKRQEAGAHAVLVRIGPPGRARLVGAPPVERVAVGPCLEVGRLEEIGAVALHLFGRVRLAPIVVEQAEVARDHVVFAALLPDVGGIRAGVAHFVSVRILRQRPPPVRAFHDGILGKLLPGVERLVHAAGDPQPSRAPQHPVAQVRGAVIIHKSAAGEASLVARPHTERVGMPTPVQKVRAGRMAPTESLRPIVEIHEMVAAIVPEGAVRVAWHPVAVYDEMVSRARRIGQQAFDVPASRLRIVHLGRISRKSRRRKRRKCHRHHHSVHGQPASSFLDLFV